MQSIRANGDHYLSYSLAKPPSGELRNQSIVYSPAYPSYQGILWSDTKGRPSVPGGNEPQKTQTPAIFQGKSPRPVKKIISITSGRHTYFSKSSNFLHSYFIMNEEVTEEKLHFYHHILASHQAGTKRCCTLYT